MWIKRSSTLRNLLKDRSHEYVCAGIPRSLKVKPDERISVQAGRTAAELNVKPMRSQAPANRLAECSSA